MKGDVEMTKGERIRTLRKNHKMSQDDLAKILDTTKQAVWKYEHDIVTNIPTSKIEIMANLFHVTPEYICCWDIGAGNVEDSAQELLYYFRMLNDEGKENVISYIKYIADQAIYKKSDKIEKVVD